MAVSPKSHCRGRTRVTELFGGAVRHRHGYVRLWNCPELVVRQELAHWVVDNSVRRLEDATSLFQIHLSGLVGVLGQLDAAAARLEHSSKPAVLRLVEKVEDLSGEKRLSRRILIECGLLDGQGLLQNVWDVVGRVQLGPIFGP